MKAVPPLCLVLPLSSFALSELQSLCSMLWKAGSDGHFGLELDKILPKLSLSSLAAARKRPRTAHRSAFPAKRASNRQGEMRTRQTNKQTKGPATMASR